MPWLKSSVPKFGNWDKSQDVSYSIIFDKARAEKEKFLHISESEFKDFSSGQNFYKNNNVGAGQVRLFPDKATADRKTFYPTSQQDKMFTDMHQNALQTLDITAGRGASHVPYGESSGLNNSTSEYSRPKSPLHARILQEQKNATNILPDPWNHSDARAYNSSLAFSAPSRQPFQVGGTNKNTFVNERPHVDQTGFQGRLHASYTNATARCMCEENPPIVKARSAQGGIETSRIADVERKHTVPKFGDWGSGDRFTTAFNKVRIEKSSKYGANPNAKAVSPLRPDEDLYKSSEASVGSIERKKQMGWFRMIICCSGQSGLQC